MTGRGAHDDWKGAMADHEPCKVIEGPWGRPGWVRPQAEHPELGPEPEVDPDEPPGTSFRELAEAWAEELFGKVVPTSLAEYVRRRRRKAELDG